MITVKEYLNQKKFQWKEKRGQAIMNCPFCDDKEQKFAIGLSNGAFNCLRMNNCGAKGSFYDLQKRLGDTPQQIEGSKVFCNEAKKSYKVPKVKILPMVDPVIKYHHERGFTDETLKYFKVGARDSTTAMLPYFKDGVLVNVKYRDIINKKNMSQETNAEQCLFNRDNIEGDTLTITEGEYDTMALHQYGIKAVSVPGGASSFEWVENEWEYLASFSEIYLCLDNDNAGIEGKHKLITKLGAWRCKDVILPMKDANDCLLAGVSPDEIMSCFHNAQDCKPVLLANPSQFRNEVIDLFFNQQKLNGTQTPWEGLNSTLKGWRDGELTVWSGRSGAGKSTILNQVILGLADQGIRTCVASLELPAKRYLRWAVVQKLQKSQVMPLEVSNSLEWMDGKIYIMNTHEKASITEILEVFEYAARRYDVKHFVVDSLMRVSINPKEELAEQKNVVSDLMSFSKKFGGHVHLVAHPRKGFKDSDKPGKVDVRGASEITDIADNVLVMWRPEEEEKQKAEAKMKALPDAILFVKKNREFGYEGIVKLSFDESTRTFRD